MKLALCAAITAASTLRHPPPPRHHHAKVSSTNQAANQPPGTATPRHLEHPRHLRRLDKHTHHVQPPNRQMRNVGTTMSTNQNVWFDTETGDIEVRAGDNQIAIWQHRDNQLQSVHIPTDTAREIAHYILAIT